MDARGLFSKPVPKEAGNDYASAEDFAIAEAWAVVDRVVRTQDLNAICSNQERDAFGEVVSTCGSLLEESLRVAWADFCDRGPPDRVDRVEKALLAKGGDDFDLTLEPYGVAKIYGRLLDAEFFKEWLEWRLSVGSRLDLSQVQNPKIQKLARVRNEIVHRRSAALYGDSSELNRSSSREYATATFQALHFLGQVTDAQLRTWIGRLTTRPKDPSVVSLPAKWYPDLIGRQAIVDRILDDLKAEDFRRHALEGGSGVGKSSIALEVASRAFALGTVSQAVWVSGKIRYYTSDGKIVEKMPISDGLSHTTSTILRAFQYPLEPGDSAEAACAALLEDCEKPLLVMDNWESLQHFEDLGDFLNDLRGVRILYTSRRGVTEARPRRIGGLDYQSTKQLLSLLLRDTVQWNSIVNFPTMLREIHTETAGNPLLLTMISSLIRRSGAVELDVRRQLFRRARGRDLLAFMHDYNIEALGEEERQAFAITPILEAPLTADAVAAALNIETSRARQVLNNLVEVNLAEVVFDPAALSLSNRERYRVHAFSLEHARRLIEGKVDLQKQVLERLRERHLEDEAVVQLLRDRGLFPEGAPAHTDVVPQCAVAFRRVLTTSSMAAIETLESELAEEIRLSGWFLYLRLVALSACHRRGEELSAWEARLRSAPPPYSSGAITWIVNDAMKRQKPESLLEIVERPTVGGLVDLKVIHQIAVHVSKERSEFELAEALYEKGMGILTTRQGFKSLRQKHYYLMARVQNIIVWTKRVSLEAATREELLTRAIGLLDEAQSLPFADSDLIARKRDELGRLRSFSA